MNLTNTAIRFISLLELNNFSADLVRLPFNEVVRRNVMFGQIAGADYVVASAASLMRAIDLLQGLGSTEAVELVQCSEADFQALTQRISQSTRALNTSEQGLPDISGNEQIETLSLAGLAEETNPIIKLLGSTLFDASRNKASDIHIETNAKGAAIKYRLDGMLIHVVDVQGRETVEQLISRLKVLSLLDVGERRLPQDGRMAVALDSHRFELRVSILPGIFGESAVLRLLDRSGLAKVNETLGLEQTGLSSGSIDLIRKLSRRPHGMLLLTGPTGSGKTTTLYAAVAEINDSLQKIITVEDPVEYQLPGILQIAVNEKTGLTFSRGLRAILRHDPDTILIGEIRDTETAQIAVQAAMTGHLVFSSVHANSSVDVIGRLTHMGVDGYNLASALNGVVSQRLLRKVCTRCSKTEPISAQARQQFPELHDIATTSVGIGCGDCRGTGYRGRIACAEVFELDDQQRESIVAKSSPRQILAQATRNGMVRIADQARALVASGVISLEEYGRVAALS